MFSVLFYNIPVQEPADRNSLPGTAANGDSPDGEHGGGEAGGDDRAEAMPASSTWAHFF